MKCLSLKQPYAELLISGKKTIELRKWNTSFRGKFLVHASCYLIHTNAKIFFIIKTQDTKDCLLLEQIIYSKHIQVLISNCEKGQKVIELYFKIIHVISKLNIIQKRNWKVWLLKINTPCLEKIAGISDGQQTIS
jgi:hypothetical protein